jgi:glycosyltransferase involved in cell wall biosynthesis
VFRNLRVAVVLPAHNEERFIGRALRAIPPFVDAVYAVDDASDDETVRAVLREIACDPRISLLCHHENRGVGASIVTGYRAALTAGSDIVVVMDGDGQMHPGDLPTLLGPIADRRAEFVKGNRFDGLRPRGEMPATRLLGNIILSAVTRLVAGIRSPLDAQCGYTAISASALSRLPLDSLYPRYGFPNDLLFRALEAGFRVLSVPVRAVYGEEISGIRPIAIPRIFGLLLRAAIRRVGVPGPAKERVLSEGAAQRP